MSKIQVPPPESVTTLPVAAQPVGAPSGPGEAAPDAPTALLPPPAEPLRPEPPSASWAPQTDEDQRRLRARIEYEDGLLHSRAGTFLTGSGLLVAALAMSATPLGIGIGIAALGLVLSVMWLYVTAVSTRVIAALAQASERGGGPRDPIEDLVRGAYWYSQRWLRPNRFVGYYLPSLFLAGWMVYLGWAVWGP